MLDKVRRALNRHGMTTPGDRVLVAVSGGPDSLALLLALHALAHERQISLHVYTLDHGLRGSESAADAAFVSQTAASLGVPCTAERVDVRDEGFRRGLSLQAAARALRYARLAAVASAVEARRIATGHNKEDQAETVLLRLMRGAGVRGLAGIPPVREGRYIRPLLDISRAEIETFLAASGISPRRDPSNEKIVYLRNRIRLELLPQLRREYNPRLVEILATTADRLRQDADYVDGVVDAIWPRLADIAGGWEAGSLNSEALLAQHPALVSRVLQRAVAPFWEGTGRELSSTAVAAILDLVRRGGSAEQDLGAGVVAWVAYGRLGFGLRRRPCAPIDPVPLPVPGEAAVSALGIKVEATLGREGGAPLPVSPDEIGRATFSLDRLPGTLAIRTRRPGDRLWPVGMNGSQKLQDILVNSKVPRHRRDLIPLLVAGPEVLWVVGYRLDRRWSVPLEKVEPSSVLIRMCSAPLL